MHIIELSSELSSLSMTRAVIDKVGGRLDACWDLEVLLIFEDIKRACELCFHK